MTWISMSNIVICNKGIEYLALFGHACERPWQQLNQGTRLMLQFLMATAHTGFVVILTTTLNHSAVLLAIAYTSEAGRKSIELDRCSRCQWN